MKVFEILLEIKTGQNLGDATNKPQYWVFYNKDTIHTFPKYNKTIKSDLMTFFNDGTPVPWSDNNKDSHDLYMKFYSQAQKFLTVEYGKANSYGYLYVDNNKKTVNLDITKFTGSDDRRLATKIANYNHKAKSAYPILGAETGFSRVVEIKKVLKQLVKIDSKVSEYVVTGDDRINDNSTVQNVLDEKSGLENSDHTKLFSPNTLSVDLFHGTSKSRAKKILKEGFKPGTREEVYGDLVPNYSEENIYLTLNPATAAGYAVREAINTSSDAVILKVTLSGNQLLKLRPDEDSMHWIQNTVTMDYYKKLLKDNPILQEIWGKEIGAFTIHFKHLKHSEKKFGLSWILNQYGVDEKFKANAIEVFKKYDLYDKPEKIQEMEYKLYSQILKTYIEGTFNSGVKKQGTIAYPGKISPSQISVVKTWSIKDSKIQAHDYDKEKDYDAGIDKQQASVIKKSLK